MAITVDVEVASDTPHPARIGLNCQLAQVAERVNWLRLGREKTIPTALLPPVLTAGICHCQTCIPRTSSRAKTVCAAGRAN
ncbi:hypothetical protein ACLB1N_16520 [Escherichia coli]